MTTLREAAQQALEALEKVQRDGDAHWPITIDEAITALRAALEQPGQEPVAWMVYTLDGKSAFVTDNPADFSDQHKALPLFTHPPRREWKGLTEEEMHGLYRRAGLEAYYPRDGAVQYEYERRLDEYARAIEQALKERNHE